MKTHYKSILLLCSSLLISFSLLSQLPGPGYYQSAQKQANLWSMKSVSPAYRKGTGVKYNHSAQAPAKRNADVSLHFLSKLQNKSVAAAPNPNESVIGDTRYDKQTNGTMQNRIVLFEDGTIGAIWTLGYSDPNFPDRGTGYNYYDGASWFPVPSARLENKRTGWPSIAKYGPGGEIVVAHNGDNGLEISRRNEKGTGQFNQSLFQGPATCPALSWPRVVTNGPDNNQIHLISVTEPVANGGSLYHGQDGALVYSRSLDGGATWDILNQQLPGTDINYYVGLGGDTYAWAEPKGDTLALVVGDKWFDVFLLKSNDNGLTWTKSMIYQHPFPFYEENHTVILDTIWVCDGGMAIQLDNEGKANVFFGLMRVNNPDTTDEEFSYWYMTDGIAYWKEGDPAFTCIEADTLYEQGHLVGWMQDLNGNDTIYEELSGIPAYTYSTTGMPTVTIDASGDMYLVMSSEMENINNGIQNYRRLMVRKWDHTSGEWGDFFLISTHIIHNFHECIFPYMAANSDAYIHFIYQADEEPGLAVSGDEDPYGENYIYYAKIAKSDFVGIAEVNPAISSVSQNYPNPASGTTNVLVSCERPVNLGLTVTDFLGRNVYEKNYGTLSSGDHLLSLDVSSFSPGIYLYTVKAGEELITKKLTVQ